METLDLLAAQLGEALLRQGETLAVAESCTGGWLAKVVTDVPGSSEWFERGFVTYSNEAKEEMLGVFAGTLQTYGAVSEEVVREMVAGALGHSRAGVAVAISGIAGPGGGSAEKPVGTVCIAWGRHDAAPESRRYQFQGNRESIRRQSVVAALQGLLDRLP